MLEKRIKALLFAYACEPNKGSEPGIGWNWSVHLSKLVDVTVVTRKNNKKIIEKELNRKRYNNLSFIYFDIPVLSKIKKILPFGVQFYYLLWEYFVIKKIADTKDYDVIQRITFGSTVTILRFYKLDKPYILSFCAGGEVSPKAIYKRYSFSDKAKEILRKHYNSLYKHSSIIKRIYSESKLIVAVTTDTKKFIENFGIKNKIIVEPAIGLNELPANEKGLKSFKIIYAGSLIYWKNVDIIIKAIEKLNDDKIVLDIYGSGDKEKILKKYVYSNNLESRIHFNGNISRDSLLLKYNVYDLAIHSSSHDSGSMFLLEAISAGVPVLFLNTGGPKEIFNGIDYPLKVNPNLNYDEIIHSFKEKIEWFYENYDEFVYNFRKIREEIIKRFNWENKAKRMVEIYKDVLNENTPSS
ncbi:glycosyltransferase [Ignavibacteria bacterium 4148-Me]|uniref:glycosyltransferase n=1 Tax=Rosettibacter primus TaxID=3111523 RepID=UPI00336BEC4D